MAFNFLGKNYPTEIIMQAPHYYVAYKLSYPEIEKIFAECHNHFDHSTLNRWVINYALQLDATFRKIKLKISSPWRMDEIYIKINTNGYSIIDPLISLVRLLISI